MLRASTTWKCVWLAWLALAACRGDDVRDASSEPSRSLGQGEAISDADAGFVAWIRTRDDVELRTWVALPDPIPKAGVAVVLWRSPYRVSGAWNWESDFARFLHARGFGFILQDVRGRPDSTGEFEPLRHEIEDGRETTRWIVSQPWSNGRIATMGGSYDGYTALAAAVDNPDVQLVISDDGSTDERSARIGGTFSAHTLNWLHLVETGEWLSSDAERELTNALDPMSLDVSLLGHVAPYWRAALEQESPRVWPVDGSLEPRWKDLCVPIVHVYSELSGWNDPLDIWRGIVEHGCSQHSGDQFLSVTPDAHTFHLSALGTASTPVNEIMLRALDAYVGGRADALDRAPHVAWIQHGEARLRPLDAWPPAITERTFHLVAGEADSPGSLISPSAIDVPGALDSPPGAATSETLVVDPAAMDPCDEATYPTLWYVSAPLQESMTVAGSCRVELSFEADVPDTDLVVALYERGASAGGEEYVYAGWGAVRARWRDGETSQPLEPGTTVSVSIVLTAIAHEFPAGSSLVMSLAPGACGLLENPLTGEPVIAQTRRRSGTLRIWHDAEHPSRLIVPVLE